MAFAMVKNMATWVHGNVEAVLARGGEALWQSVLDTEWGGALEEGRGEFGHEKKRDRSGEEG